MELKTTLLGLQKTKPPKPNESGFCGWHYDVVEMKGT
jgi:hypothetical protein